MKKVVEAYIIECGGRRKGGNVTAQIARALVSAHNHGHGVPTNQRTNPALHKEVTRHPSFLSSRNGVSERCSNGVRQLGSIPASALRQALQNVLNPIYTLVLYERLKCIKPFARFNGIIILVHQTSPFASKNAAGTDLGICACGKHKAATTTASLMWAALPTAG